MSLESVFKLSLVLSMIDRLTGPMARVSGTVGDTTSKLDRLSGSFGSMVKSGAVMAGVGSQIAAAALAPVKSTFETRRALGELSSLGVRDLTAVEAAARSFSDQWAGTTKSDFISAAYDIKSGIASLSDAGVADMTRISSLTAKATKSTAAEMSSLFATGYGIYKDYYGNLSDMQFGEMFSAGIAQSVQQFKTTGSGMAQGIQTLGASATTSNVPLEEQLSILGMLQATMGGAEAGTKYKAFLRSATKGGEALGLSFTDANNQLLTLPQILETLRGKFGETMDAAEKMELQKAFGDTEAVALIDLMYGKVGALQTNIEGMQGALSGGISKTTEMANAMQRMKPDRLEVLEQHMGNIGQSIGNAMLPAINSVLDKTEAMVGKLGTWVEGNKGFSASFMLIVLTIGSLLMAGGAAISLFGAFCLAIVKGVSGIGSFVGMLRKIPSGFETLHIYGMLASDSIKSGFAKMRTAGASTIGVFKRVGTAIGGVAKSAALAVGGGLKRFGVGIVNLGRQSIVTASTALAPLIASVWGFTAALLANPITWIVIGIVALIAAIVLLYNKCEWFRNGVQAVFGFLKEGFGTIVNGAKSVFTGIGNVVGSVMDAAKATVSQNLDSMKAAYESHGGGIRGVAAAAMEGVKGYYTAGYSFIDNLTGGKLTAIKDKFLGGMSAIRDGIALKVSEFGASFSHGLETIKSNISNAVQWFFSSGQRVVTTFANGIRSAFHNAVGAVCDGLQKIRNMLAFSDSEVGPLSTLTLSGQRTMSTYAEGISKAQSAPRLAMEQSLDRVKLSLERESPANISYRFREESRSEEEGSSSKNSEGSGKQVIIQKVIVPVDLRSVKDLQSLMKLLAEMEDYSNGNGDEDSLNGEAIPVPI